jgi:predicted transcriptional regulator of viral defense system
VQGKPRRVATIGRTFLDMLRAPDSCGGIYHVMDRYAAEAPRYLRLIVDEIDRHGTNIDKVRAGYVLAERLKLAHPAFDAWRAFAQRGGSRKLYAQAGYSPRFSETWCLSINIDEADAAEEA